MNDTPPQQHQPQSAPLSPAQSPLAPQPEAVAVAPKPKAAAPADTPKDAPDSTPQKPLPEAQDDTTFNTSVRDAYALLDFATRRGMVIPNEITTTIVKTYDKVADHDPIQVQDQAAFWVAFRDIIDLVKPVTVESILFSAPKTDTSTPKWWWNPLFHSASPADRVLKRYLFFAMASLLLLLVLQMEWAIGTSTYNDAFESHTYLTNTQEQLEDAELKAGAKVTPSEDGASSDAVTLSSQNDITLKKLQLQHDKDQSWDDVSYVRLWWWNRQSAQLFPPYDLSISNEDDDSGPKYQADGLTLDQEGKRWIELTRAKLTLEVISDYVLVTLFALLGAMTQALRTLANHIRTVSLTQTKLYSIRTRIILGVISGVCMAWLLINSNPGANGAVALDTTPLDAISFLGAFTPWAVAFISGYSVEIFFTALERAIAIITKYLENIAGGVEPTNGTKPAQQPTQTVSAQAPPTQAQPATPPAPPATPPTDAKLPS